MTIRPTILATLLCLGFATGANAQGAPAPAATPSPTGAAAAASAATPAQPARRTPTAAQTAQQERMRSCNAQAATQNLRGDARRSFMSGCLAGRGGSGQPAAPETPPRS